MAGKREIKDRPIVVGSGLTMPPVIKKSKYPWDAIIPENDEPPKHFFVQCEDEGEAAQLRTSIHSSGTNYYLKRNLNLVPVCRAMQVDGKWGVAAVAIPRAS